MINNNSLCHHLDFLNYIEIEDGLEYEFSYDRGPFLSPYLILTVDDIRQDIARDIELNWTKISKKGSYLPIKLEVYAYEGSYSDIIGVRLLYDPKTYYYMLAEKEVNKILEDLK